MTYGIAAYKVTPQFCEDEVNYIIALGGIEIKYNQELGKRRYYTFSIEKRI